MRFSGLQFFLNRYSSERFNPIRKNLKDSGIDLDRMGYLMSWSLKWRSPAHNAGEYRLGGQLQAGKSQLVINQQTQGNLFHAESTIQLIKGTQTVKLSFDGLGNR